MKKTLLCTLILIVSIATNITKINYAQQHIESKNDNYNLSNYDEMVTKLKNIEKHSSYTKINEIGKSTNGKDIYLVTFGIYKPENPTVLILTQQHGNEGLPTESALNFIKRISIDNKNNLELIDKVNILVLPRLNVDGAEGIDGIPTRLNLNEVDLNRDHFSKTQSETQALHYNVLRKYKIDYMIDFHQKHAENMAMLYPTSQGVKPEVLVKSKKLGAIVYKTVRGNNWGELSEYHGGSKNIIARNEVACEYGIATLLLEMGGMIDYYDESFIFNNKQNKKLVKEGEYIMINIVNSIANKEIDRVDISIWNKLCRKVNIFI